MCVCVCVLASKLTQWVPSGYKLLTSLVSVMTALFHELSLYNAAQYCPTLLSDSNSLFCV